MQNSKNLLDEIVGAFFIDGTRSQLAIESR